MKADGALVTVDGFLATVGNDDFGHPQFQPLGELVALLWWSDALVEFGEDFAEAALGVGLSAAHGFVPRMSCLGVATRKTRICQEPGLRCLIEPFKIFLLVEGVGLVAAVVRSNISAAGNWRWGWLAEDRPVSKRRDFNRGRAAERGQRRFRAGWVGVGEGTCRMRTAWVRGVRRRSAADIRRGDFPVGESQRHP